MDPHFSNADIIGKWIGSKKLWLPPDNQLFESQSTAAIRSHAQGRFLALAYQWSIEEDPQDGLVIFPAALDGGASKGFWLDSWHMRNEIMVCEPQDIDQGIQLEGSYPAPDGEVWGWQIVIQFDSGDFLRVQMVNVSPEGEEATAVEAEYEPAG